MLIYLFISNRVGARNQRNVAALYVGPTAGMEYVHGCLDRYIIFLFF